MTTAKYNKSEIFTDSWESFKRGFYNSFSDSLKAYWAIAKREFAQKEKEENELSELNSQPISENLSCFEFVGSKNTYKGLVKESYKITDIEMARELYKEIKGTFAAKVLETIINKQNCFATEKQKNIIILQAV